MLPIKQQNGFRILFLRSRVKSQESALQDYFISSFEIVINKFTNVKQALTDRFILSIFTTVNELQM